MNCPKCGFEQPGELKFCPKCGEKYFLDNKLKNNKQTATKDKSKLEGFSGWLALFGLAIFITPIVVFFQFIVDLQSRDGFSIFFNILIILLYIWLNYLMIKRKKVFKKWFVGVSIFQIVLSVFIALAANSEISLYSESEISDINTTVLRTILYAVIWSLYLWNSQRAKNTFIN